MSMTVNGYTYDYLSPDVMRVPELIRKPRPKYPINGNNSILMYEEDYKVLIDYYKPLKQASRHPTLSNTFWAKDSDITDIGNGIGTFTRFWYVFPGSFDKGYTHTEYESYGFTVPAIDTAQSRFYQFPVASNSTSNGITTLTVTTGAAPFDALDIDAGKPATIFYIVTDPKNGQQLQRQAVKEALTVGTATITFNQIIDIGPITYTGVQRTDLNQPSYTKQVMSKIVIDYFILGVNVNSEDEIPIIQELQIIDNSTGGRTTTLSDDTTPSFDDWLDSIAVEEWFCVEPSTIERFDGSIFARKTRYIRYTK